MQVPGFESASPYMLREYRIPKLLTLFVSEGMPTSESTVATDKSVFLSSFGVISATAYPESDDGWMDK